MSTTIRKTVAIQWVKDPVVGSYRKTNALAFSSNVGGTVRQLAGYAFTPTPPSGTVRQMLGYAFTPTVLPLPLSTTGDVSLYGLINNQCNNSLTVWSSSNSALGTPTALTTSLVGGQNTSITLSAGASSGYSGSMTFYYARRNLGDAFTTQVSLGAIASATTIWAMLPTINSKYGTNLTTADVVNGTVNAGVTVILLTAAATSWMFNPGSQAQAGTTIPLTTAIATPALPGFSGATGVNNPRTNTQLLMHFDPPSPWTDAAGHVVGIAGSPTNNTTTYEFGGGSLYCGTAVGNCVYVNDAPEFELTSNFTIEAWVYPTLLTGLRPIVAKGGYAGFYISGNTLYLTSDANTAIVKTGSGMFTASTWNHVAVTRQGNTFTLWINGGQAASATITSNNTFGVNGSPLYIGGFAFGAVGTLNQYFAGEIDEVRISNIARYTGNFTPPSAPFILD